MAASGEILSCDRERYSLPTTVSMETRLIRALDVIFSLIALFFFAPLLLIIAVAVYVSDPGDILFAQRRIGFGGVYFRCFKFRSMAVNAEDLLADLLVRDPQARLEWELNHKLKDDPRVTRVGSFLRKSSLDELPQLLNVLLGQMSIVGPRPIVEAEKIRYGRYFEHDCLSRPGITGLWQISKNLAERTADSNPCKFLAGQSLQHRIGFEGVVSVMLNGIVG